MDMPTTTALWICKAWDGEPDGLLRVAKRIADTYAVQGHARLALWLALSGWEPRGSGLFEPLVEAVHRARLRAARDRGVSRLAARTPSMAWRC